MNASRLRLLIACSLAPLAAATGGCAERAAASAGKPPVAVAVERAPAAGERARFEGPGSVQAAHTYRLAFEVPGRVASVAVDVGDRVRAGQTLATLETSDYRAQLDGAQARAASAAAQAERAERGARPEEVAQAHDAVTAAQAQVARANAAAALARSNDARTRSLLASGDVAAQQGDATHAALVDAEQQLAAARAQLLSAQQNAALVTQGPRSEDRATAYAQASAARADAAYAEATLAKTVLRAPADGYVQARALEPGDDAQPGVTAIVLTAAETPDIVVAVPERVLAAIAPGTAAVVLAEGRRAVARVTRIEPAADPATRASLVRVRAASLALRPGAVVDVQLAPRHERGTSIEPDAILHATGGTRVEVYDAAHHTVAYRSVRVLRSDGERATVDGLAPGTQVVVAGQHEAQPGDPVRIVDR